MVTTCKLPSVGIWPPNNYAYPLIIGTGTALPKNQFLRYMILVFPRYNQLGMVYDRFATCQARSFRTPWPVHHWWSTILVAEDHYLGVTSNLPTRTGVDKSAVDVNVINPMP